MNVRTSYNIISIRYKIQIEILGARQMFKIGAQRAMSILLYTAHDWNYALRDKLFSMVFCTFQTAKRNE